MTATTALTLPRRPPGPVGPRRLPAWPADLPYDDEPRPIATSIPTTGTGHPAGTEPTVRADAAAVHTGPRGEDAMPMTLTDRVTTRRPADPPEPRPGSSARGTTSSPTRATAAGATTGARAGAPARVTGLRTTAAMVVRAIVEVLSGARPVSQLAGWTSEPLQADLARIAAAITVRTPSQVRSVRVSEPRPGAAEVSAVVSRRGRMSALALRMEFVQERWRVTTLQVG